MGIPSVATLAAVAVVVAGCGLFSAGADPAASPAALSAAEPGHGLPGILDFGQGTCVPCLQMMPLLEELARRYEGKIAVRHLDTRIPENQDRADMYGIRFVPTQVFVDATGEERIRHEGVFSLEDIELELENLGWISRP